MNFKHIFNVGGLTLLSRISGFIRDIFLSATLGTSVIADAFFVALKMPNFFRRLFAEGAFGVSFVPLYSGYLGKQELKEADLFAGRVFSALSLFVGCFSLLMIIFMPYVITIIAPSFADEPAKFIPAVLYSRISFCYLLLITITALMGFMLNSHHYFAPFAASSIIFNVCLIIGVFASNITGGDDGLYLVISLVISGIIQVLWMWSFLKYRRINLKFHKPRLTNDLKKLLKLMVPGAIGAGVMQINLFVDMILASLLPTGAISYLFYADRLNQLPLSIFGIALGTVLLPTLSKLFATGEMQKIHRQLELATEFGLLLSLPAAFALIVIPDTIIGVLFERGEFTHNSTLQTSYALAAYAIGIPAYVLTKIYSVVCFARQDTKSPVVIGIIVALSNAGLAYLLIHFWAHTGIAFATGVTAWLNVWFLSKKIKEKTQFTYSREFKLKLLKMTAACLIMCLFLWGFKTYIPPMAFDSMLFKIGTFILMLGLGCVIYFTLCIIGGIVSLTILKKAFRKTPN